MSEALILESTLRCPECGHEDALMMPTNACIYYHECTACSVLLKPKSGDCCVFCSYATVPCPPFQRDSCCRDGD